MSGKAELISQRSVKIYYSVQFSFPGAGESQVSLCHEAYKDYGLLLTRHLKNLSGGSVLLTYGLFEKVWLNYLRIRSERVASEG